MTFLSYYFTLFRITSHLSHITSPFWYYFHTFCRITSSFWYYFHTFCRITSPLWYYFHTFSRITSPLWYYSHTLSHVTSPFHRVIVDSSKPRFTLGWIQNVWYKTYNQLGYRIHKHRVKIFPCVWFLHTLMHRRIILWCQFLFSRLMLACMFYARVMLVICTEGFNCLAIFTW